jgi:hypothetical protein
MLSLCKDPALENFSIFVAESHFGRKLKIKSKRRLGRSVVLSVFMAVRSAGGTPGCACVSLKRRREGEVHFH